MSAFPAFLHPGLIDRDRQIVLADVRRIKDLRLFLRSCRARLKRLCQAQAVNPDDILRERSYIEATLKEIDRLEYLVMMRCFAPNRSLFTNWY